MVIVDAIQPEVYLKNATAKEDANARRMLLAHTVISASLDHLDSRLLTIRVAPNAGVLE